MPKVAWALTGRAGTVGEAAPDVAVHVEADYSGNMQRLLTDSVLDLAVMYEPRRSPGLIVEKFLEEPLVLVSAKPRKVRDAFHESYVYVDWGPVFRTAHAEVFPDVTAPAVSVGLGLMALEYILHAEGSGYVSLRDAQTYLDSGRLHMVVDAPKLQRLAWLVYADNSTEEELQALALDCLRQVASKWIETGAE